MAAKTSDRLTDILEQGIDWKTRTLYLIGAIDDEKSFRAIPLIRLLDEGKGPIKIFLASHGGDEAAGFAIFDSLRLCRNRVEIYGYGGIYSIAALIFQAGNARYLAPNAQLMMHNGTMGIDSPTAQWTATRSSSWVARQLRTTPGTTAQSASAATFP